VKLNEELAMKLFTFADKYVQNNLREKCISFLKHKINSVNVYKILDFARQENISLLEGWCLDFLNRINTHNVFWLVEYLLSKPNDPEFVQENLKLRDIALPVVLNNYLEIFQDQRAPPTFYEDFLIKNIALDTVVDLGKFIYCYNVKPEQRQSQMSEDPMARAKLTAKLLAMALSANSEANSSQNASAKIDHNLIERIKAIKKFFSDYNIGQLQELEDKIKNVEKIVDDRDKGRSNIKDDRIRGMIEGMEKMIDDYKIKMNKLKSMTANLKPALMKFIQANFQTLFERNIAKELPNVLLVDLILPIFGTQTKDKTSQ